ncbi:rhodanese-like domain-containing protein [Galactobacillus timonensis]|uniref:rhodanese-like domain-containing protein n=1 Tax=Galactobacillus timonensis TaxID=2041840 RepID=UPI000C8456F2|nr:rhodanese-like domain-containing protein [Galactobacillus timonensis]
MFNFRRKAAPNINAMLETVHQTPGAVLIDVREVDEYQEGHIPGAVNIPLSSIGAIETKVPDHDAPLFVYCHSGARSEKAKQYLEQAGYRSVVNIGGIMAYTGNLE